MKGKKYGSQGFELVERATIKQLINYEIVNKLFKETALGIVCHFIVATILVVILYTDIKFNILFSWYLAIIIADGIWLYLIIKFFQIKPASNQINIWRMAYMIMLIAVFSIFGSSGILLMSDKNYSHQLFVMFILIALSTSLTFVKEIKISKIVLCLLLLPLFLRCISQREYIYKYLAIAILMYFSFLLSVAARDSESFKESLTLRFKNIILNRELEKSNELLEQKVIERTAELAQARTEAELANRAKTEFLGIVSHELRTPLRSINSGIKGIKKYLPSLVDAYQVAREAKLSIPYIVPRQYNLLPSLISGIEQETNAAFSFINMLLANLGEIGSAVDQAETDCSMAHCVEIALERYPFLTGEKELIDWQQGQDFIFRGNELLMVHVIFNLLKNALQYIHEADKGRMTIWFESNEDNNILHFKDTAKGISVENLPHVFDRYFSKSEGGTGLGLAFCKMIMASFGGTIVCEAKEGVYTRFSLCFLMRK